MSRNASPTVRRSAAEKGTTLTEMLTVCAIVAILLNVTLGVYEKVRECAWNSSCTSNLRQTGIMLNAYREDNHGFLPEFTPAAGLGDRDNWYDIFSATDWENINFSSVINPIYGIAIGNTTVDPRLPRLLENYTTDIEVMFCPGQGPSASWKDIGPYYYNTNDPFGAPPILENNWYPMAKVDNSAPLAGCQNPVSLLDFGDRGWRHGKRRGEEGSNNHLFTDGSAHSFVSPTIWECRD